MVSLDMSTWTHLRELYVDFVSSDMSFLHHAPHLLRLTLDMGVDVATYPRLRDIVAPSVRHLAIRCFAHSVDFKDVDVHTLDIDDVPVDWTPLLHMKQLRVLTIRLLDAATPERTRSFLHATRAICALLHAHAGFLQVRQRCDCIMSAWLVLPPWLHRDMRICTCCESQALVWYHALDVHRSDPLWWRVPLCLLLLCALSFLSWRIYATA
jgi:hypothetical protein